MRKTVLCIGVLLGFLALPCTGEMLDPPPADLETVYTPEFTLFPGAGGWIDFHQYNRDEEDMTFGKDYQIALIVPFFSSPRFNLHGMAHEIVQGRHLTQEEKLWLFSPRMIISDLRFFTGINFRPVELHLGFHHDCAHGIDGFPQRSTIHEAVFTTVITRKLELPWGDTGFYSSLRGSGEIEFNVLVFLQTEGLEPDRFRFSLWTRGDIAAHPLYGSIFVSGKYSLIHRETEETPVQNVLSPGHDWYFRAGYRTPGRAGGVSLYYQVERITDGWEDKTPEPRILHALGIVMSIDKFSAFSYHAQQNEN